MQIDKKEDASIVYLSAANRIIAPARSNVKVEISFRTEIPKQKNRFGYVLLMDTKCINFHFAFQASRYTKTDNGMKIHIWETTMKRMSMRQQIMMLHFCIRKLYRCGCRDGAFYARRNEDYRQKSERICSGCVG